MNILRGARYIAGVDIIKEANEQERQIKADHGLPAYALPAETGMKDFARIEAIRMKTIAKYTGALVLRSFGIDAVYRLATNKEFPQ
jgi:hypothetical protein